MTKRKVGLAGEEETVGKTQESAREGGRKLAEGIPGWQGGWKKKDGMNM